MKSEVVSRKKREIYGKPWNAKPGVYPEMMDDPAEKWNPTNNGNKNHPGSCRKAIDKAMMSFKVGLDTDQSILIYKKWTQSLLPSKNTSARDRS